MNKNIIKKLIYNWCNNNGQYGLTLPYLIGAIRFLKEYEFTINDFFSNLINIDIIIKISYCQDLDELIFGTFKSEDAPKEYYDKLTPYIYISNNEYFKDYNELIAYCLIEYSSIINNTLYSKDMETGQWKNFEQNDFEEIKKLAK